MKEKQRFERVVVSREEALAMFQENKFKVEIISGLDPVRHCCTAATSHSPRPAGPVPHAVKACIMPNTCVTATCVIACRHKATQYFLHVSVSDSLETERHRAHARCSRITHCMF